ncbi:MAG: hypothetical protein Q4G52_11950 [Clostridia bacterium]|nr:hypothetical protein [Clostridia bacterium]
MKKICGVLLAICLLCAFGAALAEEWTCEVCAAENDGNFCANCGSARPDETWICPSCGKTDNKGNFCTNCGSARPAGTWTCPGCGQTDNEGNFCTNCGTAKPAGTTAAAATAVPAQTSEKTGSGTNIPSPVDVFGVTCLETDEEDGLSYFFYELPNAEQDAGAIYAKYKVQLLSRFIRYDVNEEYGWLNLYVNNADESNAVFAVLDDSLMLVVDSGLL